MSSFCDHITTCKCGAIVCSYCIECCSGCEEDLCEKCYNSHTVQCNTCKDHLCPTEIINNGLCPLCNMKHGGT